MSVSIRRYAWVAACAVLFIPAVMQAQVTTADILGTVTDASGAALVNANVTATLTSTAEKRTTQTDQSGEYAFQLLPIGTYSITIEAAGFSQFLVSDVTVVAGDRRRVDAKLQVGQVSQTLEVNAQAAALQTDSSTVESTVSTTAVEDLPTNGRNFITLVQIQPGLNESNQSSLGGGSRPDDRRQTSTVSANGQSDSFNNFLLDGLDNNERAIATVIVKPSIDALAEVEVQTNMYPASVGRAGGAVINEITKSGSNGFHGTVYEFLRNDVLDANYYFNQPQAGNPLAGQKPEFRQNDFGGSIGGPIKKDKLFFFVDYEGFRRVQGVTQTAFVPSPCELGRATCNGVTQLGNFSDFNKQVASPSGTPYLNNVVPLSQISAVSRDYAALYPTVSQSNCTDGLCPYVSSPIGSQFAHTGDVRIDDHIGDKDSYFARYSINQTETFTPPLIPAVNVAGITVQGTGANFNTAFPSTAYQRQQSLAMGYTHIFQPNLLLQLSAQVFRYVTDSEGLNNGVNVNNAFGGPANINTSAAGSSGLAMAWFLTDGYNALGDAFALPTIYYDTGYQYSGTLNWTKGNQTIKIGASLIRRDWSVFQNLFKGAYLFLNGATGNSFAAMLQGDPLEFLRNMSLIAPQYRTWEIGEFIQDDWRVTPNLTLNLGLRYDIFTPLREKHNDLSNFDPTNAAELASGRVQIAGQNGVSDTLNIGTQYGDVQPRFGFAWSLGHGTVLRGGFGMGYFVNNLASPAYLKNAPFTSSATLLFPGFTSAPPIVPDPTCLVPACGATGVNNIPSATQTDFKWGKNYMVNMTLEKQFAGNIASVSYVGEFTRNLPRVVPNIDSPVPPLGPGGCGATTQVSVPGPCQPYYSQLPLTSGIQLLETNGVNNYNALEALFQRRLQQGLTLSANYTYTSNLADVAGPGGACTTCAQIPGDYARDYGPSDYMVRHRFSLNANYLLPFGKNMSGFSRQLVNGWQINGIYVYSTGTPFTVVNASDQQNTATSNGGGDRPNVIPTSGGFTQSLNEWFNISQFQLQPYGTAGDEGHNDFFMPPYRHLDLSLFKDFRLRESVTLQFRAESFNITNTPSFGQPNNTISQYTANGIPTSAGNFGKITSTNTFYTPREIQFALKLIF